MTSGEWHIPYRVDLDLSTILGWISHRCITKGWGGLSWVTRLLRILGQAPVYIAGQKLIRLQAARLHRLVDN